MTHKNIEHQTILITGASSGIGAVAAQQLASQGAKLILVARRENELAQVSDAIAKSGGTAYYYSCDLSNLEAVDALADSILAQHGKVDVLVNNAARSIRRSVRHSIDRFHDYQRCMQINYFAAVRLSLKLLPAMLDAKRGHIINISTWATLVPSPRFSAYVGSKSALDGFSASLDTELKGTGVAVTSIHFPLVRTAMSAPTKLYAKLPAMPPEKAAKWIVRAVKSRPPRIAGPSSVLMGIGTFTNPRTSRWISRKMGI